MKIIRQTKDIASVYKLKLELELDDDECDIIKEALDSFHDHLIMANKNNDSEEYERVTQQIMKVENICHVLKIPGYEWS